MWALTNPKRSLMYLYALRDGSDQPSSSLDVVFTRTLRSSFTVLAASLPVRGHLTCGPCALSSKGTLSPFLSVHNGNSPPLST